MFSFEKYIVFDFEVFKHFILLYESKIFNRMYFQFFCIESELIYGVKKHIPNLIVSSEVCEKCQIAVHNNENYQCQSCQTNSLQWFWSDDQMSCVNKFIFYLESFTRRVTAICHNFKSYDGHFIMEAMSKRSYQCNITMNGWKIMYMQFKNVRIVDSINFLQMPLASFAKVFSLPENLEKQFFPHLFNEPRNQLYSGPIPAREYFMTDQFSKETLAKFNAWYNAIDENYVFDFSNELLDYCISDVKILRTGIMRFIDFFKKCLKLNPVLEAVTLTSAVMLGYRLCFMPERTLGIVPNNNYCTNKNQSKIGRMWIEYMTRKYGQIQVEYKLPNVGVYVDGYCIDKTGRTPGIVFEMLGCYWHSCDLCYSENNMSNEMLQQRRESTRMRMERIRMAGYKLIWERECKFNNTLKANLPLQASLENSTYVRHSPINVRDAVFGGLVEVFKTYYKCKDNEMILSWDMKSMYPFSMRTFSYPIGHPRILRNQNDFDQIDWDTLIGFVKCEIIPPRGIFNPVLPVKSNNRLIMGLCNQCINEKLHVCTHSENERCITGTWVSCEVNLALKKGYKIRKIIEVWDYKCVTFNPETKEGGLFTEYINYFISIKEAASSWPREDMSEEEKTEYIFTIFGNGRNISKS